MERNRVVIAAALLLAGALLSGLLLMQHHGEPGAAAVVGEVCGEGRTSGCDVVAQSEYSELAGVPFAAVGLFFYLALLALIVLASLTTPEIQAASGRLSLAAVGLALAVDVALLGIQAFAIEAFCRLCLMTYVANAGVLWALWPSRRATPGFPGAAGRLVLAGWSVAGVALALAVAGGEAALEARQAQRAGTLLGAPAATADAGELQKARDEIQRLKETLDDPQKFERYQQEKSARDFETAAAQELDLSRAPSKGPATAQIKVVEYSDFLCPFCRAIAGAFRDYVPRAGGRVSLYFKNYPLDKTCNDRLSGTVHPGACWVASGSLCAQEQGRFWEYHDKAFEAPPRNPTRDDVVRLGVAVGLDSAAFGACLDAAATRERLQADIGEAVRLGVNGTPTVYINGKRLPRINDFLDMVDKEAARLGLPPVPRPASQ